MATKKTTTKKSDTKSTKNTAKTSDSAIVASADKKVISILEKRVTEKSGLASNKHAYTFLVPMETNKSAVIAAFKKEYKKNPVKVAIARMPSKPLLRAGRPAWKSGYKKAIITLKSSDKIEFM